MSDLLSNLPRVKVDELLLYDYNTDSLASYLSKKASNKSKFSKGKWQKRWFEINHNIDNIDNYTLSYYYSPDDLTNPRQTFDIANATVTQSGGNSFTIELMDGSNIILAADSIDLMEIWIDTLEKVISVASIRDKLINNKKFSRYNSVNSNSNINEEGYYEDDNDITYDNKPLETNHINPFQANQRKLPTIRFDINLDNYPPSSSLRRQLIDDFIDDLSTALNINKNVIEVINIKPYPGINTLTIIEFDINPYLDPKNKINIDYDDSEQLDIFEQNMDNERREILMNFYNMINNSVPKNQSPIKSIGAVSINNESQFNNYKILKSIDPSFHKYIVEDVDEDDQIIQYLSPEPRIMQIFNRYKDVYVPNDILNITTFTIYLSFEGVIRPFYVPNPIALPRRDCAIWPYEIKQTLGLMGTLQELWIEPMALIPRNMPKSLSQPIVFEPSARLNGAITIHASRLKADLTYEVQCEDYRGEVLRSLTDEEMDSIRDTFNQYDLNHDGNISKYEMEELIRTRINERSAIILEKFNEIMNEPNLTNDDIKQIENSKQHHLQSLDETKSRLLKMFDAADINGDGLLSFTEFMLMEAWWMRCTLNPEKAHLF